MRAKISNIFEACTACQPADPGLNAKTLGSQILLPRLKSRDPVSPLQAAVQGRPGAAYVDIPSDVLMASAASTPPVASLEHHQTGCSGQDLHRAVQLLQQAQR